MQIIEFNNLKQLQSEMLKLNCDSAGIKIMQEKGLFRGIKIKDIKYQAALILKQNMLSLGGDVVTPRDTISGKVEMVSVLLLGTIAHYKRLCEKLYKQPYGLSLVAEKISQKIRNYNTYDSCSLLLSDNRELSFKTKILVMGILNCTPDSFSDGGEFHLKDNAINHARQLLKDGADIIDVGGESSRPGAKSITVQEEGQRIFPVIKELSGKCVISVDTYKAVIAKEALSLGAQIINDITALRGDNQMADVIAESKGPIVLMHMQGTPQTMQKAPCYDDIMYDLLSFFEERIAFSLKRGIKEYQIIIDPGIGFGKTTEHNITIMKNLEQLKSFGLPVLLGPSRKSFIGNILQLPVEKRLEGTAAVVCIGIQKGVKIIRVHDVLEMSRIARTTKAILN